MRVREPSDGEVATLLEVRGLNVAYGKVDALLGATLRVNAGQIVTVIGPNGAGKTTMLAAIMGQLGCSGEVNFLGRSQAGVKVERRVAAGMSLVPERRELFGTMSIEDNLLMGAYARHSQGLRDHRETMDEVFRRFPRLKERRGQLANTLSGGERAMLVLGRALMGKPRVLLLDEPSLGLAPLVVREVFRIIADLRRSGVAILLVEQNARAALQVSDHGYVLETGTIVLDGPSAALAEDPRVAATYLGGAGRH
ncbi:ABC transporter ATP-binding protein [Variovorax sp. J22G73]|uniref:ABC transporter ATP-binding protein n=1 Tax=unclassified Variovorax TaxID=663243 RepID=UPI0025765FCB|nr:MULTISPECIES: ABC transporter ATP-binding protein [unclassified Variovorax]MDM0009421.1 ABC transporter ATP-binding protein [Variovorax sp. J22R203]MDM0101928.1 ABC transporter ATP-binding protein [Variovorax sp. J22G73]